MGYNNRIVVAGAGHAGVEAAIAIARLDVEVILVSHDNNAVARMSCNPAIGGLAKGHLVKEIDALGGEMGYASDHAGIQFKTLNKSKGRAVWSPRAQIDKLQYSRFMLYKIKSLNKILFETGELVGFKTKNGQTVEAILKNGTRISCEAIIVTSGTFQNGLIHIGKETYSAGRFGEKPAIGLSESLQSYGINIGRLKTGTPPRILKSSVNWNKTKIAPGDEIPKPFSFRTPKPFKPTNIDCHIVYTNNKCHDILHSSLHNSAMYSGKIKGVGPRYCPSIEDKIVRFSGRDQHQLFLEPEWYGSNQIYVNGFSTSMSREIQLHALQSVSGLEEAEIIRPGYAIEYDYVLSSQLKSTLESKSIEGLFFAGQINGTSGYEEAAAQGLIAGINAVQKIRDLSPLILHRNQAYIGVLIDDLITKDINDPYRMFTSSAEYRLTLRPDTADIRLTEIGKKVGLVSEKQFSLFQKRISEIEKIKIILDKEKVSHSNDNQKKSIAKLILNPQNTIENFQGQIKELNHFSAESLFTAETDLKYAGYIVRENDRVEQLKEMESTIVPATFDYFLLKNISLESREKLSNIKPETLGQASRIAGVTPSDISVLSIFLKRKRIVSRET